ncbi:MAG: (deoxy)nucleoside triphosphate pyrophosphohydrolase [Andreesenia angusta]|nr:(deoxy)nucleoside triphosphate pyrophosphohydrolase [Andreesenia angusta]
MNKKTIRVVAAIIIMDDKVLACQRGYGEFKGKWEFPGGKIEVGETKEKALIREIHEELSVDITIHKFLTNTKFSYDNFNLDMDSYICSISKGKIDLKEHSSLKWLAKSDLNNIDWIAADIDIVNHLKKLL